MNQFLSFLAIVFFIFFFWGNQTVRGENFELVSDKYEVSENVLSWTLCYLSSGKTEYLEKIIKENKRKPNKYLGIVDLAEFVINKDVPSLPFAQSRLRFLLLNRDRFSKCLIEELKLNGLLPSIGCPIQIMVNKWSPSELYVEGLFKLIRGVPNSDERLESIIDPLYLKKGDSVADIGFADGQNTLAIARQVGIEGEAIGVEISPVLVDFLNFMSKDLDLPQLQARLCVHTDIMLPPNSLDAAFIRFVFSNLRDSAQPWVNSIFKAIKPGGRVIILQHYDPMEVKRKEDIINKFLDGGELPISTEIPCTWRSPDVVKKLCTNAGFRVSLLKEEVEQGHVYLLVVRK